MGVLAATLGIPKLHWVGHSSSCQMGLQLALERPDLVQSLILIEPAAGGGFGVPASEALGRDIVGPALAAFGAGDVPTAFEMFMKGVCGANYRQIVETQGRLRAGGARVCVLFPRRSPRGAGVATWR